MSFTCSNCVLDKNDDPNIFFNEKGVCNHCLTYEENIKKFYKGDEFELKSFNELIQKVKKAGQNSKYDLVIGLSGGVDSTFVAYLCWIHKLKVLAVHLDNGWNSELSVVNIRNILKITEFDLFTYVINWQEFRDLQRAYFKANVVDIEALTDHSIASILFDVAKKNKINYIFEGSSITTEGRLPDTWIHNKSDSINIKDIHSKFGEIGLKTYPFQSFWSHFFSKSKIKSISILDYYPYNKAAAKKLIIEQFHWRDYGGKHYESIFTRFYQAHILPRKFGIDKRKSHYSTLICAKQMTRIEALNALKEPTYLDSNLEISDYNFVLKKLGFSKDEFEIYIKTSPRSHMTFRSINHVFSVLVKLKRILLFKNNSAKQ
jgi:N-acetyl sugar amidotransferase